MPSRLRFLKQTKRLALRRSVPYRGLYMLGGFNYNLLLVSTFDWDVIEINLSIHHQQRVWLREHILIDANTIKELLEDRPELDIFLLKSLSLLLDSQMVKLHLVVPFEEGVKVCPFINACVCQRFLDFLLEVIIIKLQLLDFNFAREIERKNLL